MYHNQRKRLTKSLPRHTAPFAYLASLQSCHSFAFVLTVSRPILSLIGDSSQEQSFTCNWPSANTRKTAANGGVADKCQDVNMSSCKTALSLARLPLVT